MRRSAPARAGLAPGRFGLRNVTLAVVLGLAGLTMAGCATEESEPPAHTPEPTEPAEPTEQNEDPRVQEAIEDLAERRDTDPAAIQAGPLEAVTWSDGSLGCPEEGMGYTQALVDGYRLELTAEGEVFAYHGDGQGELFLCTDPVQPVDSAPADLVDMD